MDRGLSNESSSISSSYSAAAPPVTNNSNMFLKQANKNSHKIAKPFRKPLPLPNPTNAAPSNIPLTDLNPYNPGRALPQSQQPAVYNINKSDFRDVVQKLTGSPAHERLQTPPPPAVTQPRPPSSRLQRIRPPPLSQISNRPNQITQIHAVPTPTHAQPFLPYPPSAHPAAESPVSAYMRFLQNSASPLWNGGPRPDFLPPQNEFGQRPPHPFSPLYPLESPVSAYMRFLQNSASSAAPSPLWNGVAPIGNPRPGSMMPQNEFGQRPPPFPPLQPLESPVSAYMRFPHNPAGSSHVASQQGGGVAPPPPLTPSAAFPPPFPAMPLSPLPFGCILSPRSPYSIMSPRFLFSPMGQLGFPQLPPLSPTGQFGFPSPRWRGM
ncbi:hypothetical protein OROMI_010691 [Orobanche minor]